MVLKEKIFLSLDSDSVDGLLNDWKSSVDHPSKNLLG